MRGYTISGELRGTSYRALGAALAKLVPSVTEEHDVEFEWRAGDMDINIYVGELTGTVGVLDYMISGWLTCTREEALERAEQLVKAFDAGNIVYRIELDTEDEVENLLTK